MFNSDALLDFQSSLSGFSEELLNYLTEVLKRGIDVDSLRNPECLEKIFLHGDRRTRLQEIALVFICAEEEPLSLRRSFYRAVSAGLYPDTSDPFYDTCGERILKLRRLGILPYRWITDSTRRRLKPSSWSGLEDFAETVAHAYRKDLWQRQPDYVEIFVEKDALAGVVEPITEKYDVCLTTLRGNCSETMIYRIAEIFREIKKPIYCYYLGDHDVNGLSIDKDFLRRLTGFLGEEHPPRLHWQRLAVTGADFRQESSPGVFEYLGFKVKRKGKPGVWQPYLDQYGDRCVEVDAIPSGEIRDRVEKAILNHVDAGQWQFLQEQEAREREMMRTRFGLTPDQEEEETEEEEEKVDKTEEIDEEVREKILAEEISPSPSSSVIRDSALLAKIRAKIGRAYRKAGKADASEDEKDMFCGKLVHLLGVDLEHRSSGRIARVLKGELPPESLLK
jgi:hypothetical protein